MLRRISFLVVVVALVAAACADDAPAEPTPGPATTAQPPDSSSTFPTTTGASAGVENEPPFPQEPTEAQARSAALLFDWPVTFTKTETVVASPIGDLPNGAQYMITLEVEGICDDADNCIQESNAHVDNPLWGWTITEPLVDSLWALANSRWTIGMAGYYLSADYGNGNTCIYAWTEEWDIQVTDAVQNGNAWLGTGFSGTMVRSEGLDPGKSAQGIANEYCPEYQNVTKWDADSTRVMAPIPPSG